MVVSRILFKKIIRPSSSTPTSFRRHNLSFIDHITNPRYAPIAAFYPKSANSNISQASQILENSLSKVLTSYYPFAGRIKDGKYVDCNDIGAEYLNVRISCPMSKILNHAYNDAADIVFPKDLPWSSSFNDNRSPLVVQLSHFDCGGVAVSICISHKIADGYSLCKFFNDWAATARQSVFKPSLQFDVASFFPLMDDPPTVPKFTREPQRCVSRMYHFSSSSLGRLKDTVVKNSEVQNPTRVEVASALLHKCGVEVSMSNSGLFKPSLLVHTMSLRPPLSLNTIGNAFSHFSSITATEDEIQVPHVVAQQRKAKQQLRDKLKDMNGDQLAAYALEKMKAGEDILERNMFDFYFFSSLCNFGYTTDFGWGRPIKVTITKQPFKNSFNFLDNPSGDGVDALITLTEADMLLFQSNIELLEFASPVVHSLD